MMKLPAQPNRSLIDGVSVLQELASRGCATSCSELSEALHIEKTKVNRILKTLAYLGMVSTTPSRKYQPGEGMHILAAQSIYGSGLLNAALKHLSALRECGHTVALGVLWRDRVSYLYHCSPGKDVIEGLGRHGAYPLGQSSPGMAIAAGKSDEELHQCFPDGQVAGFDGAFDEFLEEMRRTRERGYACIKDSPKHITMAVSIGNPAFAAIALAGEMKDTELDTLALLLKAKADAIEYELNV